MKISIPNSAWIQNVGGFLSKFDPSEPDKLEIEFHDRWVAVHPSILALTACAGLLVKHHGGTISGHVPQIRSLPYLIRMGLFDYLGINPGQEIAEHEAAGRFVPLTNIRKNEDLRTAITDLVPLLHAPPEVAAPIKYVFSEMVRNALEHSGSPVGAVVCAQYFKKSNRISIGIADAGRGILKSMRQHHAVANSKDSIGLALQPGITGVTSRIGGDEFNAGAGLFFTKSIAALSRNLFLLYSGDSAFKLLRVPRGETTVLKANPQNDKHRFLTGIPEWHGTIVGIDINVEEGRSFAELLDEIRQAYSIDVKSRRKAYYKKARFV